MKCILKQTKKDLVYRVASHLKFYRLQLQRINLNHKERLKKKKLGRNGVRKK